MDSVDKIIKQWHEERPDLDVSPMELIGRIKRLSNYFSREMDKTFSTYGLNGASFDVLATLRRSGDPCALSPGDLLSSAMVTSGTMTNRIDQLVKSGLVERKKNSSDARRFIVHLTAEGRRLIDKILEEHVKTQKRLLVTVDDRDREKINSLLRDILIGVEGNSVK